MMVTPLNFEGNDYADIHELYEPHRCAMKDRIYSSEITSDVKSHYTASARRSQQQHSSLLYLFGMGWLCSRETTRPQLEPSGDEIMQWYQELFENSTTFASILASVMFSAMILDFYGDYNKVLHDSDDEVRVWAATGAMLFVLLVLLCKVCSLGLRFKGKKIVFEYDKKNWGVRYGLALASLLFQGLVIAGTMFFCLIVKAYAPVIGLTALGITSIHCLISICLRVSQSYKGISAQ
jgi:hypothetical protein